MRLGESRLISTIHKLFRSDERLIYFFFNHKRPELRAAAVVLLREARGLSHGEYLLIQAALDFWNGEGSLRLSEALKGMDDENILAFIRAILYSREIDIEFLTNEDLC